MPQYSPIFDVIQNAPKLIQSWPEEVQLQLFWAYESAYHEGVSPRGGLFKSSIPDADKVVKGEGRSDFGVGAGINPQSSLAVRWWRSCVVEVDPVYRSPVSSEFEAPRPTMGVLKYSDSGDRDITASPNGRQQSKTARLFVPLWHHILNDYPEPVEGDLVEFWAKDWHDLGTFYDVVKVSRHGYLGSSNYHTMFLLDLQSKAEFLPERRLLGKRG